MLPIINPNQMFLDDEDTMPGATPAADEDDAAVKKDGMDDEQEV